MHLLSFFIPCAPEVQMTHRFVFKAIEWRLQPWPQAERIDCGGQKSFHLYLRNPHLYFTWVRTLLCVTWLQHYQSVVASSLHEFLNLWQASVEVTSPCVGNSQRKEPVFSSFNPKSEIIGRNNAVNVGIPLLVRDSSLNSENKVKPDKYLLCPNFQLNVWLCVYQRISH